MGTPQTRQGTHVMTESLGNIWLDLCTAMLPVTERLSYRNIFRVHCKQVRSGRFSSGRSKAIACVALQSGKRAGAHNKKPMKPCQGHLTPRRPAKLSRNTHLTNKCP
jgi:hypothetical protein